MTIRLKTFLFTDQRPGHEKQSKGVLSALGEYLELNVTKIKVPMNSPLQAIVSHARYMLTPRANAGDSSCADHLLIGSGSRTHIPLLMHKKRYGGRAVTCMTPSTIIRSAFDLCFCPLHDNTPRGDNIVQTIGPPNLARASARHEEHQGLILIGGEDKSSHHWPDEQICGYVETILSTCQDKNWLISSSPRTPPRTENLLVNLLKKQKNGQFISFTDTEPGWVEDQYERCQTAWISADSISMVYEALSAGCRVGIIPVPWKREDNKFSRSLRYLEANKLITPYTIWESEKQMFAPSAPLQEADRCAREMIQRWWPESLQ